ncbi:hypothetical protein P691DRAFT_689429, partial [Macrolepiota fuliginosa MF-IS2]
MTEPIPSTEVGTQLQHSIIPSDYIVHWHFVWNSPKAEFATVWIDLLDSQQGTRASQLISCRFFLNEAEVLIKGAKAHTSMPQCQQHWHWGHSTEVCCHLAICCPICTGPHSKASHRQLMGCCRGNPKATPPIPPTPVDTPCPHIHSCINCGNKHAADNHCCPYWQHC